MNDTLEALTDARIALSYLRRVAVEGKDKALADRLTAQIETLKIRIGALRLRSQAEWEAQARGLEGKIMAAQGRLEGILKEVEQGEATMDRVGKAAGVVDDILALLGKA